MASQPGCTSGAASTHANAAPLYGGLEAGGTTCVCAVGSGPDALLALSRFATTTPGATLARALAFFRPYRSRLRALGVASFGPLDLRPDSPHFGSITSTPKAGWAHTDMLGPFQRELGVPVACDTDVNAALLAEHRWGAAQGIATCLYLTVGTGIGGGALVHGQLLHGFLHPEMGHVRVPHDPVADPFPGVCPYHGDCLEGLASGPALQARWGQPAETLPADHQAWALEAHYLALGLVACICIMAPQRIIMGGGVMQQRGLLARVRQAVRAVLNDYIKVPMLQEGLPEYLVSPVLADRAGVLGAIVLAQALP
ncbi:MAG: ROK family protein [Candidatus Tectimicrobiota bacterium]